MWRAFLVAAVLAGSSVGAAAADLFEGNAAFILRADSPLARQRLGQQFDHAFHDLKTGELIVEASAPEFLWLQANGFAPRLDSLRTAALMQRDLGMAKAIPGFGCYPSVDETYALIDALVAAHPNLASKIDIGDSWEKIAPGGNPGFDLLVLRITNSAVVEDKPKLFAMSAVHAREYATAPVNTAFARWLLDGYGSDPSATWLVDHNEFHLLLQANPDGRLFTETGTDPNRNQRKNRHDQGQGSGTARGVDLNRNYPFGWGAFGGSSGTPSAETYRGLSAGSEPENQAVVNYINSIFPDRRPGSPNTGDLSTPAALDTQGLFLDIHSVANLVLWPWGMTGSPGSPVTGNQAQLRTLGRRLAWFNGYQPDQSNSLPADGASDDNAYASLGVPAYTIELGDSTFFQDCNTFNTRILPDNLAMLRYAARSLRAPYLLPAHPDVYDLRVTPNLVFPGENFTLQAIADDQRFSQVNGVEPSQPIQSASASIDVPPWSPGSVLLPMQAEDGLFDNLAEPVQASVGSAGLGLGRHLLYVQASDATGVGTPDAVFVEVVEAATVAILNGQIRAADSGQPLSARLVIDGATLSSATDGNYSFRTRASTVDLLASQTGFLDESRSAISLNPGQTRVQDFELLPTCDAFVDSVEGANPGWSVVSPWGVQTGPGISGSSRFWSDSPGGDYANNVNAALTSPLLDFSGLDGVRLEFDHRCVTEAGFDFGHVDVSINGGTSWTNDLFRCDGNQPWQHQRIELPSFANQANVRLRFRFTSDTSVVADGWQIDNIRIESAGPACRARQSSLAGTFRDGFE